MKHRRIVAASLTLVLALFSLSFKDCKNKNTNGGQQQTNAVREAAIAADDIAAAVKAMTDAKEDLLKNGKITKAESHTLTQLLLKVEEADRAFISSIRQVQQFNASNKPNFLNLFTTISSAVDQLNTSGVLGIQNADAKSRLSTIITTFNAAVAIIRARLGQ